MLFCLFCFLMLRRPPRATLTDTLFPYPTLFRSRLFGVDILDGVSVDEIVLVKPTDVFQQPGVLGTRQDVHDENRLQLLAFRRQHRSEEHTSELQSLMRISYAVFCLKNKTKQH